LGGAQDGVGKTAPSAAVSARVGDTAADMPTAPGRHPGGGQLTRMQGDGLLVAAVIPLDPVAAVTAPAALPAAQQPAGTVRRDLQAAARVVGDGQAAVPAPGRKR
jgi:hypothetical protein